MHHTLEKCKWCISRDFIKIERVIASPQLIHIIGQWKTYHKQTCIRNLESIWWQTLTMSRLWRTLARRMKTLNFLLLHRSHHNRSNHHGRAYNNSRQVILHHGFSAYRRNMALRYWKSWIVASICVANSHKKAIFNKNYGFMDYECSTYILYSPTDSESWEHLPENWWW